MPDPVYEYTFSVTINTYIRVLETRDLLPKKFGQTVIVTLKHLMALEAHTEDEDVNLGGK